MSEKRVCLLSDFAAGFAEKGRRIASYDGSLWNNIIDGLVGSSDMRTAYISGISTELTIEQLIEEQFTPFCKIDSRRIYIQRSIDECWIAIIEGSDIWDLSEWGENYTFVTRLLAEVYFMITRDDFKIDEDEKLVFEALVGAIEASREEVADARYLVYWTLLENVIEDEVITQEEERQMAAIRDALGLNSADIKELHEKLMVDYYNITIKYNNGEPLDPDQLETIRTMAAKLGVDTDFLN